MADFLLPARGPEDWQALLADPEKHWRTGFSAKALAYCWMEARDFPPSVRTVFNASPFDLFYEIKMLLGVPELRVPLPGRGKASQSDLFVLAKSGDDLVAITVEGKVSESFDALVSEWLLRGVAFETNVEFAPETVPTIGNENSPPDVARTGASAGKLRRLAYLCEKLGITEDEARPLRYQLVHRTVSALIEAEVFNARHALMLVHSFSETHDGFEDYRSFASLLGASVEPNALAYIGERGSIDLYIGWVTGEAHCLTV